MNTYQFSICGLRIRLDSEYPLQYGTWTGAFQSSDPVADVHVRLSSVQKIPNPEGIPCRSLPEFPVWRDRDHISRCCWDRTHLHPHFLAEYHIHNPTDVRCSVRQESWLWATRDDRLWNGIQLPYLLVHHRGLLLKGCAVGYNGNGLLFIPPKRFPSGMSAGLDALCWGSALLSRRLAGIYLGAEATLCSLPYDCPADNPQVQILPLRCILLCSAGTQPQLRVLPPEEAEEALTSKLCMDRAVTEERQLSLMLLRTLITQVPVFSYTHASVPELTEILQQLSVYADQAENAD